MEGRGKGGGDSGDYTVTQYDTLERKPEEEGRTMPRPQVLSPPPKGRLPALIDSQTRDPTECSDPSDPRHRPQPRCSGPPSVKQHLLRAWDSESPLSTRHSPDNESLLLPTPTTFFWSPTSTRGSRSKPDPRHQDPIVQSPRRAQEDPFLRSLEGW